MALDPDLLTDRRRLKRRLTLWRGAAVIAVLMALYAWFGVSNSALLGGAHVARLSISGTISDDRRLIRALDEATRDKTVRAMILAVDSPGGTMAGGEALHGALARFAAQKPLVATLGGTAASAGYMIAMPAGRVFAREGTVTGSIGVILQSFEGSELLGSLGVRPETIASGPLKDQPSLFRPLTPEGRAALTAVVQDLYAQFVAMVAAGRHMDEERVRSLADGRVYTGRQALALGLVDAIGGEAEARAWLAAERQVPASLPVRSLDPRGLSERAFASALTLVGKTLSAEWLVPLLRIDARLPLWQR
ncbi:protease-4 [Humitalea rosea]|uniref:Protease-4 n=1 Tax=Humitalea rosea TaxID=990373 RepID=A0A2W7J6Z5_9PROT|nr:signal peptide peptidase SppA [Humitalea rosea]PZW47066.1 protease-4 [Humitalea rosea]